MTRHESAGRWTLLRELPGQRNPARILFQNVKSEMFLFYMLSNNNINLLILNEFDFEDEDVILPRSPPRRAARSVSRTDRREMRRRG